MRLFGALVVFAAIIPKNAKAQDDDNEWLASCRRSSNWDRPARFCEVREQRVPAPRGTLSVEDMRNGGATIIGSSDNTLVVKTRLQVDARSDAQARDIARQVRTVISGSTIEAQGPRDYDDGDATWNVNFVIWTPRRTDVRASSRNGPISVAGVSGNMNLETRNGPLSLRDVNGDVRARSTNGPLSISLSGSSWTGAGLDAETSNGPLSLRIPEGYSAHLEAGTNNGPMSLGFPVTMVGRIGRDISTDLGRGGPTIRAITHNGPLSLDRR